MCVVAIIMFYSVPLITLCFVDGGASVALCYTTRKQEGAFGSLNESLASRSWCLSFTRGNLKPDILKELYTHIYTHMVYLI